MKRAAYLKTACVEFNLETNTLCKKVIPVGIDDSMIGIDL